LAEIDQVVFDKTGTLTLGRPGLVEARSINALTLAAAASLAAGSRHPYARAVLKAAQDLDLPVQPAIGVDEIAGFGLERQTAAGRERLGAPHWCGLNDEDATSTLCYRAADGTITGFTLADQLRPDAAETTRALKAAGLHLEILSGDRPSAVALVGDALGVEACSAQLMPTQKITRLRELSSAGRKVLMVGDGLNDAPALAAAHASLSPASAADISQTAADAVFQGDALSPVLETLAVARTARRMALQNFAIALGYNLLFVPLAMAGRVTPLLAAIAMSCSSLVVTANALRLRTCKVTLT
jgi:P-type Cu2+ transporter